MKVKFKQIGLVAAVAAVTAGYSGVASAQAARAVGNLGDLAIVPYYTVQDDWATGVHIINSSDKTQVVKLRLRRATDSADALDFNLILSPKDEWTGALSDDANGVISMRTDDTTCTVPQRADGVFTMPDIYSEGAQEGYIEVIGMGEPMGAEGPSVQPPADGSSAAFAANGTSAIAYWAKHVAGVPRDCNAVESNFFAAGSAVAKGWRAFNNTTGSHVSNGTGDSQQYDDELYDDAKNVLKVSYFVRDAASGIEFGGDAIHIADFSAAGEAFMTNQEFGLGSGDLSGFDYPDLDGGDGIGAARGKFNELRSPAVMGVSSLLNDWSVAAARNVSTDWVITLPGQYTMVDTFVWLNAGLGTGCATPDNPSTAANETVPTCDYRDLPVAAALTPWDREEGTLTQASGSLVISPSPPGQQSSLLLNNEVNVVEWSSGNTSVLGSAVPVVVSFPSLGDFGWANLAISSINPAAKQVCPFEDMADVASPLPNLSYTQVVPADRGVCIPATGSPPVVGFVAWERSFPQNPDGNYGRLIDHSFGS